jgi:hypothetical protein
LALCTAGSRRDPHSLTYPLYYAPQEAGVILRNSEYGDGDATGVSLIANLNLDFQVGDITQYNITQYNITLDITQYNITLDVISI